MRNCTGLSESMTPSSEVLVYSQVPPTLVIIRKFVKYACFRYGENLLNLEAVALESIQDCIQSMQNYNYKPFDPKKHIYALTVDIMAQLVITI